MFSACFNPCKHRTSLKHKSLQMVEQKEGVAPAAGVSKCSLIIWSHFPLPYLALAHWPTEFNLSFFYLFLSLVPTFPCGSKYMPCKELLYSNFHIYLIKFYCSQAAVVHGSIFLVWVCTLPHPPDPLYCVNRRKHRTSNSSANTWFCIFCLILWELCFHDSVVLPFHELIKVNWLIGTLLWQLPSWRSISVQSGHMCRACLICYLFLKSQTSF